MTDKIFLVENIIQHIKVLNANTALSYGN
jgi:hypothetical protein